MARMYSRKKGKHGSKKPPVKLAARWIKYKKADVEKLVIELAKKRHSSAEIGIILRDQYGIPDVTLITGKKISNIMRESKNYPSMPEDLLNLLRKAIVLREHLEKNKSDKLSKKGLENLESKIRRLSKYYSRKGYIEEDWRYDPEEAKLIVQKK